MDANILKEDAEKYRVLYNSNMCTRDEAKEHIQPYLDEINKKAKEIAKRYNMKPKLVTFTSYVR